MIFSTDKIIRLQTVCSTNDYLMEKLHHKIIVKEGTVIFALEQTTGKGMAENAWMSEPGKNLTFSVLLNPNFLRADHQFALNQTISLGVMDFVKANVTQQKVTIKWPNDIYIADRKIAGILISNTIEGSELKFTIAGIGININQQVFPESLRNPVSLIQIIRKELDLEQVLNELLFWIENRYVQLMNNELQTIARDYLDTLYRLNEEHPFLYQHKRILARITGISNYGHLQLITSKEEKIECDFKEIEFII